MRKFLIRVLLITRSSPILIVYLILCKVTLDSGHYLSRTLI